MEILISDFFHRNRCLDVLHVFAHVNTPLVKPSRALSCWVSYLQHDHTTLPQHLSQQACLVGSILHGLLRASALHALLTPPTAAQNLLRATQQKCEGNSRNPGALHEKPFAVNVFESQMWLATFWLIFLQRNVQNCCNSWILPLNSSQLIYDFVCWFPKF